jgi:membrane protein YdbS with pleckstrin-like domain
MVFGLVLGFLEGRRLTEALSAGLCASFIVADGVVKSVGSQLLVLGVSEFWMPVATGAVFALPLVVFVWMLSKFLRRRLLMYRIEAAGCRWIAGTGSGSLLGTRWDYRS